MTTATNLAFDYRDQIEDSIRTDLVLAHRRAWDLIASPGTWWTGSERVAMAAETRAADYCSLCRKRREALSPYSEKGDHDSVSGDVLPAAAIDAVHRVVTDATRLTKDWVSGLSGQGVPDTHYVELLSVVVSIRSIDGFHRAMGLLPEPLPEARPGETTRERPTGAVIDEAWVPMLPNGRLKGDEADLWSGQTGNVIRALSLVPEAVRWLKDLSAAHYLSDVAMTDFTRGRGPLSRAQTELIAGRVSAINECFY
jgi:hypothetical protein